MQINTTFQMGDKIKIPQGQAVVRGVYPRQIVFVQMRNSGLLRCYAREQLVQLIEHARNLVSSARLESPESHPSG